MKRGRNQRRRQGVNPNRALDSNGPDVRIRGTANQIYDKYQALARDASSSGDRIKAESYLQHAEHYFRLIRSTQQANQPSATQQDGDADQPSLGGDEQSPPSAENERENGRPRDNRGGRPQRRNGAAVEAKNDGEETNSSEPPDAQEPQADAASEDEKKPRRRRVTRKKAVKKADGEDAESVESEEAPAAAE